MRLPVALDFDGTIVEHKFPEVGAWKEGAVDFMKELQKRGFNLVMHSCRASFPRGAEEITHTLKHAGIKDFVIAQKPYALAYVDDRGVALPDGDFDRALLHIIELAS